MVTKKQQTKAAWQGSNLAVVAEQRGQLVGCLRALTDGFVTLYVCELLVDKSKRNNGIGGKLKSTYTTYIPKHAWNYLQAVLRVLITK